MKILGKNVFIGNLCLCTKYTTEIIEEFEDGTYMTRTKFSGKPIKENLVLIQDKHGYFLDIHETESLGTLAVSMYGAATRWTNRPLKCEDIYIDNLENYFSLEDQENEFTIKELLQIVKNDNNFSY